MEVLRRDREEKAAERAIGMGWHMTGYLHTSSSEEIDFFDVRPQVVLSWAQQYRGCLQGRLIDIVPAGVYVFSLLWFWICLFVCNRLIARPKSFCPHTDTLTIINYIYIHFCYLSLSLPLTQTGLSSRDWMYLSQLMWAVSAVDLD